MGHCVNREVADSHRSSDISTIRARQAFYIVWTEANGIEDPCGPEQGRELLLAIFAKFVSMGDNYKNLQNLRSATVKNYVIDAGKLYAMRGFKNPVDFNDPDNLVKIIVDNLQAEEDIATQRSPLTNEIYAELHKMQLKENEDSVTPLVYNMVSLGRSIGPRASEYSQTSQTKVDYHVYPSGRKVIKAFIPDDFHFFNKKGDRIFVIDESMLDELYSVKITWRIQKNRQNGEALRLICDLLNPKLCPVRNAYLMLLRKHRLGHDMELPIAVYRDKNGEIKYLTGSKIAEIIRKAARTAHPDLKEEEIMKFSAHSLRVWACVLLDEAGKGADFIKKRLRWLGESYRVYLRDTPKINAQHREALSDSSNAVMELVNADMRNSFPQVTANDRDFGEYDNKY